MTPVRLEATGRGSRRGQAALLLVAAVLLVAWSFATPIFEGPDEHLHWQYARYVHDRWQLPLYSPGFAEANQPPLYYLALAPVARHTPTPPPLVWMDARDRPHSPFLPRLHLNAGDDFTRYWPIRLARLITASMAFLTIVFCLLAGTEATGRASTGLLAGGFALLLPQFAFRATHVNNDVLVTMMAALTVWLLVRMVRRGSTWTRGWLAAAAVAATYLSKINGICVAPALAIVILTEPVPWRARLRHLSVFALALLIVAPWTIRNVTLYGDPFASGAMYHAVAAFIDERPLWSLHHVTDLPRETFKSFVGYFGYLTVKLPKWAYAGYLAFMLFALAGLAQRIVRARGEVAERSTWRVAAVLLTVTVGAYAMLVRINLQFDQPQGRYLFPALPALMVALAIGLEGWRPWSGARTWPAWATLGGWGLAHALIVAFLFLPAFYPPLVPRLSTMVTEIGPRGARDVEERPLTLALSPRAGRGDPEPASMGTTATMSATEATSPTETTWTIVGEQPTLVAETRVAAADAGFAILDIEARAPAPDVTGALIFSLQDDPAAVPAAAGASAPRGTGAVREVRIPFEWLADGKRRGPRYCLMTHPEWHGVVTGVRLVLAEQADERLRGTTVILRRLALVGSPPGNDF